MIFFVPSGARPETSPKETSRGAGATIAGGGRAGASIMIAIMAILAHLDLDAFFAAVEELEQPELRRKPLVVGGDPHGRGVVSTANYVARRFGIHSAMSCAEALRRCPNAVFVRPRHSLYREYSQAVWASVREVVPAGRAHRARRGLPRLHRARGRLFARTRRRRGRADVGARSHEPLLLARRRTDQGGRQGCVRPPQAGRDHRRSGGHRGAVPRAVPGPRTPGRRAARRGAARGRGRDDRRRARRPRRPRAAGAASRPGGPDAPRPRERDRPARPRGQRRADLDLRRGDVRARPARPRALHAELRRMAEQARRLPPPRRALGTDGDREAPLRRLLDPQPLDQPRRRDRRRRPDRRSRLLPARSRPPRPAGRTAARRRRRLRALRLPPADARTSRPARRRRRSARAARRST